MSERGYGALSGKRHHPKTTPIKAPEDFSVDYRAISRSPPNKWTTEQRITLCTLLQYYEVTGLETMLLFNSLFAKELPTSKGLSKAALVTMHHKLQQETFNHSGSWITIRKTIEAEAAILGIHLSPKEPLNETASSKAMSRRTTNNDDHASKPPNSPPEREASVEVDWPSDSDDTLLGDDYEEAVTPCKPRGRLPPERSLEIPGLMNLRPYTPLPSKGAQTWKGTPRLVFRA